MRQTGRTRIIYNKSSAYKQPLFDARRQSKNYFSVINHNTRNKWGEFTVVSSKMTDEIGTVSSKMTDEILPRLCTQALMQHDRGGTIKAALLPGVVGGGLPAGVQGPRISSVDRQQLCLQNLPSSCCYMERSVSFLLLETPA